MKTAFTIPYCTALAIKSLALHFSRFSGYSFHYAIDASEEEPRFVLVKSKKGQRAIATFAVKSSRYYQISSERVRRKTEATYCSWFPTFRLDAEIDFYLLSCAIPEQGAVSRLSPPTWKPLVLCFAQERMRELISESTTPAGRRGRALSFAYGWDETAIQMRGDPKRHYRDYSDHFTCYQYSTIERCLIK